MSRLLRIALFATFCTVWAADASAQQIGASYSTIKAQYVSAKSVRSPDGLRALEIGSVTYAGVLWDRVDFVFDAHDRLLHLTLSTRQATYADVLGMAEASAAKPDGRLNMVEEGGEQDMQLRVCDDGAGEVSLTYEATSTEG